MIRTDAYDVEVEAELTVPLDALPPLLGWLEARLADAGTGGGGWRDDAVERALRRSVLRRGRARVVSSIEHRLRRRFATPGWHLEAAALDHRHNGALVARGPEGAQVAVAFTLGVRGNRSQVGVDFGPDASGDGTLRPVIDALVQFIRTTDAAPASTPAS